MPITDATALAGATVVGPGGEKLGTVDDVYENDETGRPEWAGVKSGLFGDHVSLVPLAQAEHSGETLTVPYTKAQIKAAPHHDPGQELSTDDERQLFTHYGVPYHGTTITADTGAATTAPDVVGHDTSGPTTDDAMTRSEERLRVGTQQVESGRARLHKRVVTETVTRRCRSPTSGPSSPPSRSRRRTGPRPWTVRRSARRSTRSSCMRSGRSWRKRPSRWSGSGSPPTP